MFLPLLALLLLGGAKAPLEHRLLASQRRAGFQMATFSGQTRSQLGHAGFVAALSGFRALMADLLWIRAGTAFERVEWPRMQLLLHTATRLQPRAVVFWEMAHFHMAYDAATSVRTNTRAEPVAALRRKAELEYIQTGESFLREGIAYNPESALLWQRLGELLSRRKNDPLGASEAFSESAKRPEAMGFVRRMAAYELAKVPGRERDAYERLRALYLEGEQERLPNLVRLLSELEQKLAVPEAQRVYTSPPTPASGKPGAAEASNGNP